ncbi:MAG TPA: alcohol dehydrogenase catalytic domain-containing protein [Gaiellaceae bacterium]|nr:alcohol dehydrogenase catalytic domain-containing protein [Gaiellaceae bacterium]
MTTRAALFREPGAGFDVREIEVDEPGEGQVVVRMAAVGVCGSDLHVVRGEWKRPTPIVLGHEGAGVVEAVGPGVAEVAEGDRVIVSWAPACGECAPCLAGRETACLALRAAIRAGEMLGGGTGLSADGETVYRMTTVGALAERVLLPAEAALPLGAELPFDQAALLGCAALTGVGAVLNAGVHENESVLVIGAGGVGQFCVQAARIAGAGRILAVDPVEARREAALALGATEACAPEELDTPDEFDWAFDAVGYPATSEQALASTRGGGTTVLVGMPPAGARLDLDPLAFSNYEKTLTGSVYGSEPPAKALPRLLRLVRDGRLQLESLVGPTYSLDEVDAAFAESLAGSAGRVLVTP